MCSCGKGKIGEDFSESWKRDAPDVTRVAVSTLFAPPYIEPTQGSTPRPRGYPIRLTRTRILLWIKNRDAKCARSNRRKAVQGVGMQHIVQKGMSDKRLEGAQEVL